MDMNISLENELTEKGIGLTQRISNFLIEKISDIGIQYNGTLSLLFTLFVGGLLVFFATKIANKFIKIALVIVGVLLFIGTTSLLVGL